MAFINQIDEVADCIGRKKHHWHKADRQPGPTKIRKWMVCCFCAATCEITGRIVVNPNCGRYDPTPEVAWPDINGEIEEAAKKKERDKETVKRKASDQKRQEEEAAKQKIEDDKKKQADYLKKRDEVTLPGKSKASKKENEGDDKKDDEAAGEEE